MRFLHCDRNDCDNVEPESCEPTVLSVDAPGDVCLHDQKHFCSSTCLMHWAAAQPERTKV